MVHYGMEYRLLLLVLLMMMFNIDSANIPLMEQLSWGDMYRPLPRHPNSVIPPYYWNPEDNHLSDYETLLNQPELCHSGTTQNGATHGGGDGGEGRPFLVMLVQTRPEHSGLRRAIRDTWGASYNLPHILMPLVFLMGVSITEEVGDNQQDLIQTESNIYRDLVQYDFHDTGTNSTLKLALAYTWLSQYCNNALYMMLAHDDVSVDVYKLTTYLHSLQYERFTVPSHQIVLCYLNPCCKPATKTIDTNSSEINIHHTTDSDDVSHLDIIATQYIGKFYPAYCSDTAYVITGQSIRMLQTSAEHTPLFTPAEIWHGVISEKTGLNLADTTRSYSGMDINKPSIVREFNTTLYTNRPVMVAFLGEELAGRESFAMYTLWKAIHYHHHAHSGVLKAVQFMSMSSDVYSTNSSHVYHIAVLGLCLDLLIIAVICYLIFYHRRRPTVASHSTHI